MKVTHTLLQHLLHDRSVRRLFGYINTGRVFISIFVLFVCCMSAFLASYVRYHEQLSELSNLKDRSQFFESSAVIIKNLEQASAARNKQYQSFVSKKFDITYSVDELKTSIQNLQNRLKIQSLNSTFTEVVSDSAKELRLSVYDVQFDIRVLQDQQFFQFMDKIMHECPGLIEIREFQLKRLGQVTKELLSKVHDRKSILFDGKILIRWTFFDKAKQAS